MRIKLAARAPQAPAVGGTMRKRASIVLRLVVGGVAASLVVAAGWSVRADLAPAETALVTGEDAYLQSCAACHGRGLQGSSGPAIGPPLKGEAFVATWASLPRDQLIAFVHERMPPTAPGSLDPATVLQISNYLLRANNLSTAAAPPPASAPVAAAPAPGTDFTAPAEEADRDATYQAVMAKRAELAGGVRPVDEAMLASPPQGDWLSWRNALSTQAYSPLEQIDAANVRGLGLAWSLSLAPGTNGIAPIVHDGVMFLNNNGTVMALDARDGQLLWRYSRPAAPHPTRVPATQARSMALYGRALYVPTVDNHVLALEATSGRVLWDHEIGKPADLLQLTAPPLVVHGKVIQPVSGCQGGDLPGGCFIVALDEKTGRELWRFNTIARPGERGGDTWNGAPLDRRFGGSVWTGGSYDPELNLVYFGVGQTYTISTLLDRGRGSKDALFTDSTVALDPDTGKLAWHYQHAPQDVWDFDWAFERTVVALEGPKGLQKVVITGGKPGVFDALDAKGGRYLWSWDPGLQNFITRIDPKTGRKIYDPALTPEFGKPKLVCPSTLGNRNWPTTAFSPQTGLLYIPLAPTCMEFSRNTDPKDPSLESYGEMRIVRTRRPDSDGNFGWLAALDVTTGKTAWVEKRRAPPASAVLATGGGLVFIGARDRTFRAVDARAGQELWRTVLPAVPVGFPLSYGVGGVQYVAIVAGGRGQPIEAFLTPMTPENLPSDSAKTLMVFALPWPGR